MSKLHRISKLKFLFKQAIFLEATAELILEAETILCCVDAIKGKPCVPVEFEKITIESESGVIV